MAAIGPLFEVIAPIELLQQILPEIAPDMNVAILYVQGVMSRLCEKTQQILQHGTLAAMFSSPSLQSVTSAITVLPDFLETLVNGFFSQNLHKFLVDHPIPKLEKMFPAPLCKESDILDDYFNITLKEKEMINQLCQINWSNIVEDLIKEMVPPETVQAIQFKATFNLTHVWESTGCIAKSLIMSNWTKMIDTRKIMRIIHFAGLNLEKAEELLPRASLLLQLYLQPYLQGYPEFNNFEQLYHHGKNVLKSFSSENYIYLIQHIGYFAKEVMNVNITKEDSQLILIKPYAGKYKRYKLPQIALVVVSKPKICFSHTYQLKNSLRVKC